jgi:hypothetical protein
VTGGKFAALVVLAVLAAFAWGPTILQAVLP